MEKEVSNNSHLIKEKEVKETYRMVYFFTGELKEQGNQAWNRRRSQTITVNSCSSGDTLYSKEITWPFHDSRLRDEAELKKRIQSLLGHLALGLEFRHIQGNLSRKKVASDFEIKKDYCNNFLITVDTVSKRPRDLEEGMMYTVDVTIIYKYKTRPAKNLNKK